MDQQRKTTIVAIEFNNCGYLLFITDEGTVTGTVYEAALLRNLEQGEQKELLASVGRYAASIANYKTIPTKIHFVSWGAGFPAKAQIDTYEMLAIKRKKAKVN